MTNLVQNNGVKVNDFILKLEKADFEKKKLSQNQDWYLKCIKFQREKICMAYP